MLCWGILVCVLGAEFAPGVVDTLGVRSKPDADVLLAPVFGPELPGKYKHPASIVELDTGDLFIAYYGGSGEYELDTAVWGSRRAKEESRWTKPTVIADTPLHSDGNPVIWQAPDGVVWLFYVVRYGETWSDSRIFAKLSSDRGTTWSDSMVVAFKPGMMVRGRPLAMDGGGILLPVYWETGMDKESVGPDSASLFLIFDPKTRTWSETNKVKSRIGNIQPAVDVVNGDHLVAYCRRGGGYDGRRDGFIVKSESTNGGKTWSPGVDTKFPNPNAAVDFLRLQSGKLLLVYNNSFDDRTPLSLALSEDGDKSYPYRRDIVVGADAAYPYAIQGRDGTIHIIFTTNERTVVNLASFREEAIASDRYRTSP